MTFKQYKLNGSFRTIGFDAATEVLKDKKYYTLAFNLYNRVAYFQIERKIKQSV